MKQILLVIAMNCMCTYMGFGQFSVPIFTYGNDIITTVQFINPLQPGNYSNITPFIPKGNISIGSVSNYGEFSIKLYRYKGWENEAGDIDVINILKDNQSVLELRDGINSWSKLRPNLRVSSTNDYFVLVRLSADAVALIFTGPSYDSTPPLLTIIVITEGNAKLVFNKHMDINSITKTDTTFSMIVQSNIQEWIDANTPAYPAIKHTIWLDNGVLKFKDN